MNIGDVVFQIFSIVFIALIVYLFYWFFFSKNKTKDRIQKLEDKIDALNEQNKKKKD